MSRETDEGFIIEVEPPGICEKCGVIAECRPYGTNEENICFACSEKDPETTKKMFLRRLYKALTRKCD